jgi:hypothetical protein
MKPNEPAAHDEALRAKLRDWRITAPLPLRFQDEVWRRIARADQRGKASFAQAFAHWLESMFSRPSLAGSYIAALLVLGLTAGYWQAQDRSAQAQSEWRELYVQSVDPYRVPRY